MNQPLVSRLLNILPLGTIEKWQIYLGGHEFPPFYQRRNPSIPNADPPFRIEEIFNHPNGYQLTYDIALLKLETRAILSWHIFPACFPGYEIQVLEFSNRGYKIRKICD